MADPKWRNGSHACLFRSLCVPKTRLLLGRFRSWKILEAKYHFGEARPLDNERRHCFGMLVFAAEKLNWWEWWAMTNAYLPGWISAARLPCEKFRNQALLKCYLTRILDYYIGLVFWVPEKCSASLSTFVEAPHLRIFVEQCTHTDCSSIHSSHSRHANWFPETKWIATGWYECKRTMHES